MTKIISCICNNSFFSVSFLKSILYKFVPGKIIFIIVTAIFSSLELNASDQDIARNLLIRSYDYLKKGNPSQAKEFSEQSFEITQNLPEYYHISNLLTGNEKKYNRQKSTNADRIEANIRNSFFTSKFELLKQCAAVYEKTHQYKKSYGTYNSLFLMDGYDLSGVYLECLKMLFNSDITSYIPAVLSNAKKQFDSPELDYYSLLHSVLYPRLQKGAFDTRLVNLKAQGLPDDKTILLKALYDANKKSVYSEYRSLVRNKTPESDVQKNILYAMLSGPTGLTRNEITTLLSDWIGTGGTADSRTDTLVKSGALASIIKANKNLNDAFSNFTGDRITDRDNDGDWEALYVYVNGKMKKSYHDSDQDGINEYETEYYDNGNLKEYIINNSNGDSVTYGFNLISRSLEYMAFDYNNKPREKFLIDGNVSLTNINTILKMSRKDLLYNTNLVETDDPEKKQIKYFNGTIQYEYIDTDGNGYFEYRKYYKSGILSDALKDTDQNGLFEIKEEYKNGKLETVYSRSDDAYSGYDYKESVSGNIIEKYWDNNHDGIYEIKFTENGGLSYKYFDINYNGNYDYALEMKNDIPYRLYEIRNAKWILLKTYPAKQNNSMKNWLILSVRNFDNMEIPDSIDATGKIFTYKNKMQYYDNDNIKNDRFNFKLFVHKNQIYLIDMMR